MLSESVENALINMIMDRSEETGDENEACDDNCTWKKECDGIFTGLINAQAEQKVMTIFN